MNEAWIVALARAVQEVFENLCFMLPAPLAGGAAEPHAEGTSALLLIVEVDIAGAESGLLRLTLPDSMIASVASAMLGEDGVPELGEQYDAVCELANVVCGNVLPLIAGERAVFDLAPPRVIASDSSSAHAAHEAAVKVRFDEGMVGAWLALGSGEPMGAR